MKLNVFTLLAAAWGIYMLCIMCVALVLQYGWTVFALLWLVYIALLSVMFHVEHWDKKRSHWEIK
jgi:hypothetical protein